MSQENVEVVREVIDLVNRAGSGEHAPRLIDLLAPDVEIDMSRRIFNPEKYVGITGLRRMFADSEETWEAMCLESDEYVDAGDQVVVIGRLVGTGKGSGVEVELPTGQVWTVRGGRVVSWEIGYSSRREALEAAELAE